jgi:hypothetical protein
MGLAGGTLVPIPWYPPNPLVTMLMQGAALAGASSAGAPQRCSASPLPCHTHHDCQRLYAAVKAAREGRSCGSRGGGPEGLASTCLVQKIMGGFLDDVVSGCPPCLAGRLTALRPRAGLRHLAGKAPTAGHRVFKKILAANRGEIAIRIMRAGVGVLDGFGLLGSLLPSWKPWHPHPHPMGGLQGWSPARARTTPRSL